MRGFERCAFGLCLALAAVPAMADWKDDYARGLEAVRDGRWNEAARLMDSAIAGNAQPAQRMRLYGQRYEVYAPQHYAGLAALRQGNCSAALRYWSQSANQTFVAANAALVEVEQRGRADCGTQLASDAKPPTPVPSPTRDEPNPPRDSAAERPPAATRPPAAPRPIVQAPSATTPNASPVPPVKPPVAVASRPVTSAAAEVVRPVLLAYLGGRYADVLQLTERAGSDAVAGWHLQTLRAAAAYQLAQLGREPADAEATARAAVAQARRFNATLRPDARFFSPLFIAFFAGNQ